MTQVQGCENELKNKKNKTKTVQNWQMKLARLGIKVYHTHINPHRMRMMMSAFGVIPTVSGLQSERGVADMSRRGHGWKWAWHSAARRTTKAFTVKTRALAKLSFLGKCSYGISRRYTTTELPESWVIVKMKIKIHIDSRIKPVKKTPPPTTTNIINASFRFTFSASMRRCDTEQGCKRSLTYVTLWHWLMNNSTTTL